MKWYLIAVLIDISLLPNNVKHLFMCSLVICISSQDKCLFKFFAYISAGLFILILLSCQSSLYILDTSLLSGTWFANIFSHFVGHICIFLIILLAVQFFKIFVWSCLSTFVLLSLFSVTSEKPLSNSWSLRFTLMIYSKSFIDMALTFRHMIRF